MNFSFFSYESKAFDLPKAGISLISTSIPSSSFPMPAEISSTDDENDPDPPRQDPWQWISILEELLEFLGYRIL